MTFDWDDGKAQSNLHKHGVRFEMAAAVFLDPDGIDIDATQAGQGEVRRKLVGRIDGLLFTVVYTERGDVTRLISARRSNSKEARRYG